MATKKNGRRTGETAKAKTAKTETRKTRTLSERYGARLKRLTGYDPFAILATLSLHFAKVASKVAKFTDGDEDEVKAVRSFAGTFERASFLCSEVAGDVKPFGKDGNAREDVCRLVQVLKARKMYFAALEKAVLKAEKDATDAKVRSRLVKARATFKAVDALINTPA